MGAPEYQGAGLPRGYWNILKGSTNIPVSVKEQKIPLPKSFELYQNYPNQFNNLTNIQFSLPEPGIVTIQIFDMLGRMIKSEKLEGIPLDGDSGYYFDSGGLPSGVYYYRIELRSPSGRVKYTETKKMALVK